MVEMEYFTSSLESLLRFPLLPLPCSCILDPFNMYSWRAIIVLPFLTYFLQLSDCVLLGVLYMDEMFSECTFNANINFMEIY